VGRAGRAGSVRNELRGHERDRIRASIDKQR
jgi:hypothetical protein